MTTSSTPIPKKVRGLVTAPNVLAIANLVKLLDMGVYTIDQLAEKCGLGRLIVAKYCRAFHQANIIHITERRADKRGVKTILVYQLGAGFDVPSEPKPKNFMRDARARAARMGMQ